MEETITPKQFLERATCSNMEIARKLKVASQHHIDSFNFIYEEGLQKVCQYLNPLEILNLPKAEGEPKSFLPFRKMKIWYEGLKIG